MVSLSSLKPRLKQGAQNSWRGVLNLYKQHCQWQPPLCARSLAPIAPINKIQIPIKVFTFVQFLLPAQHKLRVERTATASLLPDECQQLRKSNDNADNSDDDSIIDSCCSVLRVAVAVGRLGPERARNGTPSGRNRRLRVQLLRRLSVRNSGTLSVCWCTHQETKCVVSVLYLFRLQNTSAPETTRPSPIDLNILLNLCDR